ncbi:MAG: helix-turn-helix domain-containing protein [Gammaproteobacteria bacterium]|nr:helix-turn-helix domain-containing protein [Gammaproteobacteria bacterium]
MSIQLMSLVWTLRDLTAIELLVLLKLADFANDNGECWPAHSTVARACNVSSKTVQRVVQKFDRLGLLTAIEREGTTNKITFSITQLKVHAESEAGKRARALGKGGGPESARSLGPRVQGGGLTVQGTQDKGVQGDGHTVQGTHDTNVHPPGHSFVLGGGQSCVHRSSTNHQEPLASERSALAEACGSELEKLAAHFGLERMPYESDDYLRVRIGYKLDPSSAPARTSAHLDA